jgi:alpha-tubulin suppressor-like RCC1 family protein
MHCRSSTLLLPLLLGCGRVELATGVDTDRAFDAGAETGGAPPQRTDASEQVDGGNPPQGGRDASDDVPVDVLRDAPASEDEGDGGDVRDAQPEAIDDSGDGGGSSVVAIAVGNAHACALMDNGRLRCWGDNKCGQLGSGNRVSGDYSPSIVSMCLIGGGHYEVVLPSSLSSPSSVGALLPQRILGAGSTSCAIDSSSVLRCWGGNQMDLLGRGVSQDDLLLDLIPEPVVGLGPVRSAALSYERGCAVERTGNVWCWGPPFRTDYDPAMAAKPVRVVLSRALPALDVSVGDAHACALVSDGSVECWGDNETGQLGRPPSMVPDDAGSAYLRQLPAVVDRVAHARQIVSTSFANCALVEGGNVLCWGYSAKGELGWVEEAGWLPYHYEGPAPPLLPPGRTVQSLGAAQETFYAVLDDGSVWCWGQNTNGECNDEDAAFDPSFFPGGIGFPAYTPRQLKHVSGAVAVAGGRQFACALLRTGQVQCWGLNEDDRLGIDSRADASPPMSHAHPLPVTVEF